VSISGPETGVFPSNFGAPCGSFPVGILSPISVIKTPTENQSSHINLIQTTDFASSE